MALLRQRMFELSRNAPFNIDTKSNLIIDNAQKLSKKLDQGGSMSTHNATSKAILAVSSLVMLVNNMMIVCFMNRLLKQDLRAIL